MTSKTCLRCGLLKRLDEYWSIPKIKRDGRDGVCSECRSKTRVRKQKPRKGHSDEVKTLKDSLIYEAWTAHVSDKNICMILTAKGIHMSPTAIKTYRATKGWVKERIVTYKAPCLTYEYYDYKGSVDKMMENIFHELKQSPIGSGWESEQDFRGWVHTGPGQQYLEHLNRRVRA